MHKILMIISEAPPIMSGISRVGVRLKTGLEALGNQVDILSVQDIPRLAIGEVRLSSMIWRAPKLFLRRLDDYDIIHIHGPVPTFSDVALLFSALRPGSKTPVVYTHHSEIDLHGLRLICDLYNYTHKKLARLADQVIVSTPTYAERLHRYVPEEYVSVVPWGVDDGWYDVDKPKNDKFTVLFVGQMRPYKGLDTLLSAMGQLHGVELQIVGGGHEEQRYRTLAAERGLDNVVFRGKLDDQELIHTFSKSHVIVLPSNTRAEAFGLVLLEGMLARCVPVVSRLPGVTDVIGDAGLSFPVDDASALAAAFARLRDDVVLRETLAGRARDRARGFSWERTAYWHDAFYDRLIALRRFKNALGNERSSALDTLLRDTISTLDASSGSIMLLDQQKGRLRIRAADGLPAAVRNDPGQELGQGISGFVALHNLPLLVPDRLDLIDTVEGAYLLQRDHIRSSLSVPMRSEDGVMGVFNLSHFDPDRRFGGEELNWLATLARRAASMMTV